MNEFGERPKKPEAKIPEIVEKKEKKISKKEAISALWERGSLQYLLKGAQVQVYEAFKNANEDINVICCSRRFGKSFILCVLAVETCLKIENAVVKFAAPTKIQMEEIATKVMRPILDDAPPHLRPEWKEAKKRFVFPNGSEIQIAATESGNIENLRGGYAHLCLVDEAGFCNDLEYAIENVLSPTTDTTGGKVILASTPNFKDPNHPFNLLYVLPRQDAGTLVKFTIYQSPMISQDRIQSIIDRYGVDSPRFKTEYLCELSIDPEMQVFSEFVEKEKDLVRDDFKKPIFYDAYVSMDIGFKDLTVLLLAWFDFQTSTIVIEDEIVISGSEMTTDNLAQMLKIKEAEHFVDQYGLRKEPTLRVSDNNNLILLNDLYRLHNLMFLPTQKDNRDAQINELKLRFRQNRIVINPRCKTLIYHLKMAKWDKHHKAFERVKDDKNTGVKGGHVDAVDSLLYLVRNVSTMKNPFPDGYYDLRGPNVFSTNRGEQVKTTATAKFVKQIMNIRKKF